MANYTVVSTRVTKLKDAELFLQSILDKDPQAEILSIESFEAARSQLGYELIMLTYKGV